MSTISPTATIKLAQVLQTEPDDSLNHIIAQTIVQQMSNIEHLSTNDIARLCSISKTTFIRFCRHLGYETFAEFKYALIHNQSDTHQKYPLQIDDPSLFAFDYFDRIANNVNWMKSHLDLELLQNIAQELLVHDHIFLLGNAQSGNSANNLMFGLLQMGKPCQVATNYREHMQIISHLTSDSMVIVISNYGGFFDMFVTPDCFENKPKGAIVYLMTCNSLLPCSKGVDHILLCNEDAGFSGGNISIDITLGLLLQYYRSLALKKE
jgi:DNA-binding MurR/RpiR family transcriptional regulator